jgi:hypothetical protein
VNGKTYCGQEESYKKESNKEKSNQEESNQEESNKKNSSKSSVLCGWTGKVPLTATKSNANLNEGGARSLPHDFSLRH